MSHVHKPVSGAFDPAERLRALLAQAGGADTGRLGTLLALASEARPDHGAEPALVPGADEVDHPVLGGLELDAGETDGAVHSPAAGYADTKGARRQSAARMGRAPVASDARPPAGLGGPARRDRRGDGEEEVAESHTDSDFARSVRDACYGRRARWWFLRRTVDRQHLPDWERAACGWREDLSEEEVNAALTRWEQFSGLWSRLEHNAALLDGMDVLPDAYVEALEAQAREFGTCGDLLADWLECETAELVALLFAWASRSRAQAQVEQFNAHVPVGSLIRYWKGARSGAGHLGRTRTPAQLLNTEPAVWIESVVGCIALSHVEVVPEEAEARRAA